MKVAIVHYWLVSMRGGEKVIEALCDLYPQADIYTHVYDPEAISEKIRRHRIYTTFIAKLPLAKRWYQRYLGLMPLALEQLDLSVYDLVISSESGPAKGVITSPDALHLCYCHSPMRYLWDMYPLYRRRAGWLTRVLMVPTFHYMRFWDQLSAGRVDHFLANSRYIARRIDKTYRRPAEVIHPPVAIEDFRPGGAPDDFYLMLGQLVAYKRPDLAIAAFNRSGRHLLVIGEGEEYESLRKQAGPNIEFLGRQPFDVIQDHYARTQALIFPGTEDFGIVPVEAMASGRPVIAYGHGGILDTVRDGVTGFLFSEPSPEALNAAVDRYETARSQLDPATIRRHAEGFSEPRFKREFTALVERLQVQRQFQ